MSIQLPGEIHSDNFWLSVIADALSPVDKTSFSSGSKNSISTSAVQMTSTNYPLRIGVTVKASSVNAGRIYIGDDNTVTQNLDANTDGFELSAGESVFIPTTNINNIYIVGSQSGQKAFWMGV